jgi:ABC-type dipeptide/oligopeptide/nickel transport system ATPase component
MAFQRATKKQSRLRMGLIGPAGSGKTYTSLALATNLGNRVAVVDTERGSASKYADEFTFDVTELYEFNPQNYINAIHEAEAYGYDVLVIDSLSHAWTGKGGALELVEKAATRSQSKNTYFAWREVTPLHNALVDAILQSPMHIIVTMRTKTEYVIENVNGKQVPKKVGLAPIQREGLEYEFDIVADLDVDNNFIVTKTRCKKLSGAVVNKAGKDVANIIKEWLNDGAQEQLSYDEALQLALNAAYVKQWPQEQIARVFKETTGFDTPDQLRHQPDAAERVLKFLDATRA